MKLLRIVQTVDDGGGRHGRFRSDRRTKPQDANTKPSLIELVRLDSGHKARGHAPVRETARRSAAATECRARARSRKPHPASPGGEEGLARREAQPARLGPLLTQSRAH